MNNLSVTSLLKNSNVRMTPARQEVLNLLLKKNRPLSHQEMLSSKKLQEMDRVTLYRTLEALLKAKMIHQIIGADGVTRYCVNKSSSAEKCSGNHIHFHCSKCNQMMCLPDQPLPWITPPKGSTVFHKQLVVYGICEKCGMKK